MRSGIPEHRAPEVSAREIHVAERMLVEIRLIGWIAKSPNSPGPSDHHRRRAGRYGRSVVLATFPVDIGFAQVDIFVKPVLRP